MKKITEHVYSLVFNSVEENCYILIDKDTQEAAIVDPGCMNEEENAELVLAIEQLKAKPVLLLLTHLHFDHIWGASFVARQWKLTPYAHADEIAFMPTLSEQLRAYCIGLPKDYQEVSFKSLPSDTPLYYGKSYLEARFVPGHTIGHIAYYNPIEKFLLSGDVLFYESIGRTDLQGGNYKTLIQSIQNEIFSLPNDTLVLPGHGIATSVGHEKKNNPFLLQ